MSRRSYDFAACSRVYANNLTQWQGISLLLRRYWVHISARTSYSDWSFLWRFSVSLRKHQDVWNTYQRHQTFRRSWVRIWARRQLSSRKEFRGFPQLPNANIETVPQLFSPNYSQFIIHKPILQFEIQHLYILFATCGINAMLSYSRHWRRWVASFEIRQLYPPPREPIWCQNETRLKIKHGPSHELKQKTASRWRMPPPSCAGHMYTARDR